MSPRGSARHWLGRGPSLRFGARSRSLLTVLAALLSGTLGSSASATECGEFSADEGDNLIIVGVAALEQVLPGEGRTDPPVRFIAPVFPRRPGVCWRREDGEFAFTDIPSCSGTTSEDAHLLINALAGDDTVLPLVGDEHNDSFSCPVSGLASAGSSHLLPMDDRFLASPTGPSEPCRDRHGCPTFRFGLDVRAGSGNDIVFGSPADDRLYSNVVERRTIRFNGRELYLQFFPEDGQADVLCGYNGNDVLFADRAQRRRHGTCFMAGPGTDSCRGQNRNYDTNVFDDCENNVRAGVEELFPVCAAMCSTRRLHGVAAPPDPQHLMGLR